MGGHPAKTRLQTENAAEGARDADRACTVAADMQRPQPGGTGRSRAGTAAAWSTREVPRVAGGSGQRAIAQRFPAEFRGCRLADYYRAGLAQPGRRRRILRPVLIRLDQARAAPGREAAH